MKFSIAIPTYKTKFLPDAIESVLSQSYQDFELIIVDDCSPEDVGSIVLEYEDERIHYYRNSSNCGALNVVDNWNICLSYCTGDYVICMGDDDRLLPCCLAEYKKLIEKYPLCNVYHAKTEIIDENGNVYKIQESRPIFEGAFSMIYHQVCYNRLQYIGDFCFSASWLKMNKFVKFDYAYGSDWVTANIAALDYGIANGQQLMFQYRINRYTISKCQNLRITANACHNVYLYNKDLLDSDSNTSVLNEECKYRILAQNLLFKDYKKKVKLMICYDLTNNNIYTGLFYWLKQSKTLEIRKKNIFTEFFKAMLRKIFK
jgi:glycosyltransferase involved in cell wall biosynthesis